MSDSSSTSDIQETVARTRAQLESTLDEIEDRLNVPKQVGILAGKARDNYDENPVPWLAAAAGALVAIAGIVIWAVSSRD